MTFRPGDPKPPGSGRKKGQVSRHTIAVREKSEILGIDPITVLLLFAGGRAAELGYEGDIIPMDLRARCAADVAQYIAPRLKAVEHSGADGGPIETEVVYDTQWRDAPATDQADATALSPDRGAASGS